MSPAKHSVFPVNRGDFQAAPWAQPHVAVVGAANGLAIAMAALASWASGGTGSSNSQLRWSSVGLLGVVVALAGNTWFLARGRSAVRTAHRKVLSVPGLASFTVDASAAASANGHDVAPRPMAMSHVLVAVPGTSRYHRPSCALATGKYVTEAARSDHDQEGRRPCEVCEP